MPIINKSRLMGSVLPVTEVAEDMENKLFRLFERYYDAVSKSAFRRDLREKQWVILLRDDVSRDVMGFSTLMRIDVAVDGVPVAVAFSGDTIIDRTYWGEQELVKTWYRIMETLRGTCWPAKLYWILVSKGYRTYLYLPTFFKEYYPRHDRETPAFEQTLITTFGASKYPRNFNPETGIVEFEESEGHLTEALAGVPPHRQKDPNVAFFLLRNPGYNHGNELVCVADFAPENLSEFGLRLVGERAVAG